MSTKPKPSGKSDQGGASQRDPPSRDDELKSKKSLGSGRPGSSGHGNDKDCHRHHRHSHSRDHTDRSHSQSKQSQNEGKEKNPQQQPSSPKHHNYKHETSTPPQDKKSPRTRKGLRIFVGTANLGNTLPDAPSLSAWIPHHGRTHEILNSHVQSSSIVEGVSKEHYNHVDTHGKLELVVFGTQESVPTALPAVTAGITSMMTGTTTTGSGNLFTNALGSMGKPIDDFVHKTNDFIVGSTPYITTKDSNGGGGGGVGGVLSGGTKELRTMIQNHLGDDYEMMTDFQRGECVLFIFLRKDLKPLASLSSMQVENTGLGHVMANKGGIGTTLTIGSTKLSFLTMHLQAHEGQSNYEKRNADIEEILAGTGDQSIEAHHSFVFGDLNYRVAMPNSSKGIAPTKEESWFLVSKMIGKKDWEGLNKYDELGKALKAKEILVGFETTICKFNPTFKLEKRSGFHYDKKRIPSYTDRILYCSRQENRPMESIVYEPISSFTTSDHKPMRGLFFLPERRALQLCEEKRLLQLTFSKIKCKSLKPAADLLRSDLDTYLQFVCEPKSIRAKSKISRTKTVKNSDRPMWMETSYKINIKISSDKDIAGSRLYVQSFLEHKMLEDAKIGTAIFDLEDLVRKSLGRGEWKEEAMERIFFRNGKIAGRFYFDLTVSWIEGEKSS